jgi:hypothetical protein
MLSSKNMIQNQKNITISCIVCGKSSIVGESSSQTILGSFSTRLLRCSHCFHEWFEAPNRWLLSAYTSSIANTDTGIVRRSLKIHKYLSTFLSFANVTERILDWGSGSGLLVRMLRDDGYDCYGLEPYTTPVLAANFTYKEDSSALADQWYRTIIAIEVVEHLENPKDFFCIALSHTSTLIFSTELADKLKNDDDWYYYSKETGQHISFFTEQSLSCLASSNQCNYVSSNDKKMHILTRNMADLAMFKLIVGTPIGQFMYPFSRILSAIRGRSSLLMSDHLAAKEALKVAQSTSSL